MPELPLPVQGQPLATVLGKLVMPGLLALVRLLGKTGKAVALLLLITPIPAAGGTLPVALTTDFHRAVHPFLPFTWVIRALRTAMFGALVLGGVVAPVVATLLGRWTRVSLADHHPALDMGWGLAPAEG